MVKSLPAMQETWVHSLGRENPLEKGKTTHSSILAWGNPMDRVAKTFSNEILFNILFLSASLPFKSSLFLQTLLLLLFNCWATSDSFVTPMDFSPPGSSVPVFQARILKWVTVAFTGGSSQPREWTHVSCTGRWIAYQSHQGSRSANFNEVFIKWYFMGNPCKERNVLVCNCCENSSISILYLTVSPIPKAVCGIQ